MNRAFIGKILFCHIVIGAFCADAALCASVSDADCGNHSDMHVKYGDCDNAARYLCVENAKNTDADYQCAVYCSCEAALSAKFQQTYFPGTFKQSYAPGNECVWFTTIAETRDSRLSDYLQPQSSEHQNVYASSNSIFDGFLSMQDGILVLLISLLGLGGYVFERITVSRRRSIYQ